MLSDYVDEIPAPEEARDIVNSDCKYWGIIEAFEFNEGGVLSIDDLCSKTGISAPNLINIINACAIVRDSDGNKMFDARYHAFIRSLDGIYFTMSPSNRISLRKASTYHDDSLDEDFAQFILSTCYNCNSIYVPGIVKENRLLNLDSSDVYDEDGSGGSRELYLLCKEDEFDSERKDLFYILCSKCRAIRSYGTEPICDCGKDCENLLMIVKPPEKEKLCSTPFDVFIYGTLASRHSVSRGTLYYLLENIKASEFFFDVNLRLSFYSAELIGECLKHATILKLNNAEVPVVSSLLGMDGKAFPYEVQRRFPVRKVLISLGSKGSVCFEGNNAINAEAGKVKVIDTVGAGDSLSAAFLYFLSMGDDTAAALSKASALADYVVTKRGAIPDYDEDIRRRLNA